MDDDRWIVLDDILAELQEVFGLSRGAAENKLRQISLSGDVRMYDPAAKAWGEAQGDRYPVLGGAYVHGDDLGPSLPEGLLINEADFDWWLERNAPPQGSARVIPKGFLTTKEAALKATCVEWIKSLPPLPIPKRDDLKTKAMKQFNGLSGRQFDAAWDEVAPTEWKRPGRRTEG
jgi:hypothetical protein